MFFRKDIPYILSILIALATWNLNQLLERVEDAPTLEYFINEAKDSSALLVTVVNLSRKVRIARSTIWVTLNDTERARCTGQPRMELASPYMDKTGIDHPRCSDDGRSAVFDAPPLQPGGIITMSVPVTAVDSATLLVHSDEAMRIVPSSAITWMIRHQLGILLVLLAGWTGGIVAYLFLMSRHPERDPDAKP